ncbi:MAG TPA: CoA pyrophosphatase [Aggregatilineaceae bacterium]|nr:CoA pyrophosphatase [Aggregatilineaceae bacterium]
MNPIDLQHVRAALALTGFDAQAAQRRMAPQPRPLHRSSSRSGAPRQASVLVLLFPVEGELALVLTQRTTNPHDVHSGQISLPGGSQEDDETPVQTALREAREEVGVDGPVQIIGMLSSLYIAPSDFEVHPVVGCVDTHPLWKREESEVVEALECPLAWLLDDSRKVFEDWDLEGFPRRVPWYNIHGRKVWGATAIILSEFEQRLRQVLNGTQD